MRNHRNLSRLVLLAGFALPLAVSLAGADQLVTFVRGQSMVAQSVEKRGTWYFLTLEGGGELGNYSWRSSHLWFATLVPSFSMSPGSASAVA